MKQYNIFGGIDNVEFIENEYKVVNMKKTFEQYHKENPEIWLAFRQTTFEAISKGFKSYGSKGIFEIMRWKQSGSIKSDGFKINNNYTSDYARKFMIQYPSHRGFFRLRKKKKI